MATRCSILDAAERVFFEQGVARTTLADIAAAAHVTRGAIYWHFANKLELFKAMQDRAMLPQEKFFHGCDIAGSEGCLERLYETTLEALRFIAADEKAKRVYTILLFRCEYVGEIEEALLRRREADERMKAVIVAVFERACREGRLRPAWEPSMAANVYLCALTGLLSEWLRLDGCFDVVETGRRMLDGLFESFGAATFMQDIGDPVSPEA